MGDSFLQRVLQRVPPPRRLRRLWRRVNPRRAYLPRVLVNGFPKAGTHLLLRCVALLPGMMWESKWLQRELTEPLTALDVPPRTVEAGPRPPAVEQADRVLAALGPGEFLMAHMRYYPGFVRLLELRGMRSLLILRDPRDVVVSLAFHFVCNGQHPLNDSFTRRLRTDEERFMACIVGLDARPGTAEPALGSMAERLEAFLPWQQLPFNYTTRFERLVGHHGGGNAEVQRAEIQAVAAHVGVKLSAARVDAVAAGLYGQGSVTFRRGQIGCWKHHFTSEHKAAFKEVAGRYLIELGYEKDLDW